MERIVQNNLIELSFDESIPKTEILKIIGHREHVPKQRKSESILQNMTKITVISLEKQNISFLNTKYNLIDNSNRDNQLSKSGMLINNFITFSTLISKINYNCVVESCCYSANKENASTMHVEIFVHFACVYCGGAYEKCTDRSNTQKCRNFRHKF